MALAPRLIAFEMPEHFAIDLREFSVRPGPLARYHTDMKDSYDLGFLFGTFLGDGHAFLNRATSGEFGNVSWSFGLGERDIADKLAAAVKNIVGVEPKITRVKHVWIVRLYSLQWTRLLAQFGKRTEKHLPAAYLCRNPDYLEGLRDGVESGKFNVHPLEGVVELLDALEPREDVVLGLLTGNVETGARTKLTAAGIDPDRFRVNAFGSDHEHRPELPAVAQRRASEKLGLEIQPVSGERLQLLVEKMFSEPRTVIDAARNAIENRR